MARSRSYVLDYPNESRGGMQAERNDITTSDVWPRDLSDVAEKPFANELSNQRSEEPSNFSSTFTLSNLKSDSAKLAARTNSARRDLLPNAARRSATLQLSTSKSNVGVRGNTALRGTQYAHQPSHVRSDIHSELRQAAPLPQRRVDTPTLIGETVDQYAAAATSTVKAVPRAGGARKLVAEKPDESDVPIITKYIQRFREAPPTSRSQRERSLRSTDLWWTEAHERDRENSVALKADRNQLDSPKRDEPATTQSDTEGKDKENDVTRSGDYLDTQSEALSEATRSNVPAVSEDGVSSKPGESESTESDLRSRAERYFTNERPARPSAFSTTNYHTVSSRALTDSDTKKPVTSSLIGQYASAFHVVSTPVSPANRVAEGDMDILQRWRLRRRLDAARSEVLALGPTASGPRAAASATSSTARRILDFSNAPTDLTRAKRDEKRSQTLASVKTAELNVVQVKKQDKQCETERQVKPTRNEEAQTEVATCRSVETQVQRDDELRLPLEFCMTSEPNTFRSVLDSATPRSGPTSAKVADGDESAVEQLLPSEPGSGTARLVTDTIAETVTDLLFGRQPATEAARSNAPSLTPTQPKPKVDSVTPTPTVDDQPVSLSVAAQPHNSSTQNIVESQTTEQEQSEKRESAEVVEGNNIPVRASALTREPDGDDDNETLRAAYEADPILQYLLERRRKLVSHLEALELHSSNAK